MGASELATFALQFGPMGLMVGYLILHEKWERDEAKLDRELSRERIDADLELARSFTLLTETIRGLK